MPSRTAEEDAPPRPRPTRVGWAAVCVAGIMYLAGSNIGSGWVVIIASVMAAAVAADVLAARSGLRRGAVGIVGHRAGDSHDPGWVELEVRGRATGDTRIEVVPGGGRVVIPPDAAGRARRVRAALAPGRGEIVGLRMARQTLGPLGLGVCATDEVLPCRILVPPAVLPVTRRPALLGRADDDAALAAPSSRGDDEITGLRERTSADPAKDVHWRASARHRTLLVRQRGSTTARRLDLQVRGGRWDAPVLDAATVVVRSLAEAAAADGWTVRVLADGDTAVGSDAIARGLAVLPPHREAAGRPLRSVLQPPDAEIRIVLAQDRDALLVGQERVGVDADEVRSWLAAER